MSAGPRWTERVHVPRWPRDLGLLGGLGAGALHRRELEERLALAGRLAADVAHELRAPLASLQSAAAYLAGARDRLLPDEAEALDLLVAELDRYGQLVEDLVQVGRARWAATEPDLEPVTLGCYVTQVVSTSSESDVTVEVEPAAAGERVVADRRRLRRVLENLLRNARVHAGGPTRVRVGLADGYAEVHVEDAGPGVLRADRLRVFEPFARGRSADGSGVGLGLTLVRDHVAAMGGAVEVRDRPGGGSVFVVRLRQTCRPESAA